ncbi:aromatic-ring-hydroxylating dioxygenase subunit beta [Ramlibacter rhizophilus]|uniref:Aromatic-ring-hydroxylating dioxygenase subunit beta n=1 Tax=Ramlibacter rhizophilus TaxID=1781167 RepID=A0A4Z0BDT7_9BURK|nr:aromatic-ring-hydroxylating dioxygenase subunit beta [Ramlibacter rhizophilus]TFY97452.1 aromatic-ring-hydroxylating dioxygenase subunit beta [Ramlibacter rhizophilus]
MSEIPGESHWRAVEGFYRREILLLQDRRYREWLGLMDPAVRYHVPVTTSTLQGLVTRENELGYYDEDFTLLSARVDKLESRQSWVEQPPSRLRYFVQVIDVSEEDGASLVVRSNLLLLQYRWNMEQQFSGDRTDTLVPTDGGLRLRHRRVVLDRQSVGKQGLSVFF